MRLQYCFCWVFIMFFITGVTMNNRNFQRISLLHRPQNAKSFGEGSYVFSTPAPLYEHGLQNEESRGVGYYMQNDNEEAIQSMNDYDDDNVFDGNLDMFRADMASDQNEYNDYENVDTNGTPNNFDYSEDFEGDSPTQYDESEYETNEFKNEHDDRNEPTSYNNYDYAENANSFLKGDEEHVSFHTEAASEYIPTKTFKNRNPSNFDHFPENEMDANLSLDVAKEHEVRRPKLKFSKSIMDKFYQYLSNRFDDSSKQTRTGKQMSYKPESRQQNTPIMFGSKRSKEKEHHHHHFNQEHEHVNQHLQKHGHEHEHVENHTYYNNHKHNHKHDHFHEHEEKNEHKQGHKHIHSHKHEHKGHGYSRYKESVKFSDDKLDQHKETTEGPKGYNNDVKAYINKHNIKTYNGFKDFENEHNNIDDDYVEEVEYLNAE